MKMDTGVKYYMFIMIMYLHASQQKLYNFQRINNKNFLQLFSQFLFFSTFTDFQIFRKYDRIL